MNRSHSSEQHIQHMQLATAKQELSVKSGLTLTKPRPGSNLNPDSTCYLTQLCCVYTQASLQSCHLCSDSCPELCEHLLRCGCLQTRCRTVCCSHLQCSIRPCQKPTYIYCTASMIKVAAVCCTFAALPKFLSEMKSRRHIDQHQSRGIRQMRDAGANK